MKNNIKIKFKFILCLALTLIVSMPVFSYSNMDRTMKTMKELCETPDFRVYFETENENRHFYNQKFEPQNGVYHGTPFDVSYPNIKNAIDTEYFWFDPNLTNDVYERVDVWDSGERTEKLWLFNWNCALKEKEIDPDDYSNYIKNTIDNISSTGHDCLVVFGKEFNINNNFDYPDNFIEIFRYISDYAKTKDNIAMVWAPNNVGSVDLDLIDFYPGDDYVDWVGMSLYVMPYFQGSPKQTNYSNSIAFVAGDYSNATIGAKVIIDFMDRHDIKKPVVITEGGVGYGEMPDREPYIDGFEYVDWATQHLRIFYFEIPRVLPQIKINVSFNNNVGPDFYRYDMAESQELSNVIKQAVESDPYIESYTGFSPVEYVELYDMDVYDELKLSAYAYNPKSLYLKVRYIIDGQFAYETCYPPYSFEMNKSNLAPGKHKITVEKYTDKTKLASKSYDINFINSSQLEISEIPNQQETHKKVSVYLNDTMLEFEQEPTIANDRTMVPMRAVFEALGCNVEWDEETRTITSTKYDNTIILKIDDDVMTRNDESIILDSPAFIFNDYTMIPLRAITEAFNAEVSWDEETYSVYINE